MAKQPKFSISFLTPKLKFITVHCLIYIYIYINRQSLKKVQSEFEIIIQFCAMCLNLCGDHTIIIHLSFLIFKPSELMSVKY